jgi:hypothetical protein
MINKKISLFFNFYFGGTNTNLFTPYSAQAVIIDQYKNHNNYQWIVGIFRNINK